MHAGNLFYWSGGSQQFSFTSHHFFSSYFFRGYTVVWRGRQLDIFPKVATLGLFFWEDWPAWTLGWYDDTIVRILVAATIIMAAATCNPPLPVWDTTMALKQFPQQQQGVGQPQCSSRQKPQNAIHTQSSRKGKGRSVSFPGLADGRRPSPRLDLSQPAGVDGGRSQQHWPSPKSSSFDLYTPDWHCQDSPVCSCCSCCYLALYQRKKKIVEKCGKTFWQSAGRLDSSAKSLARRGGWKYEIILPTSSSSLWW